jgi:hypothetical protein
MPVRIPKTRTPSPVRESQQDSYVSVNPLAHARGIKLKGQRHRCTLTRAHEHLALAARREFFDQSLGTMIKPDDISHQQLVVALDSARAAWEAVRVYWWTFSLATCALVINSLILLAAIRGPIIERRRARIERAVDRLRVAYRCLIAARQGLTIAMECSDIVDLAENPTIDNVAVKLRATTYSNHILREQRTIERFTSDQIVNARVTRILYQTMRWNRSFARKLRDIRTADQPLQYLRENQGAFSTVLESTNLWRLYIDQNLEFITARASRD